MVTAFPHPILNVQLQVATVLTDSLDDIHRTDFFHGEVSPDSIVFVQSDEALSLKLAGFGSE